MSLRLEYFLSPKHDCEVAKATTAPYLIHKKISAGSKIKKKEKKTLLNSSKVLPEVLTVGLCPAINEVSRTGGVEKGNWLRGSGPS